MNQRMPGPRAVDLSQLGKKTEEMDEEEYEPMQLIMEMIETHVRAINMQFAALCRLMEVRPDELVRLFKDEKENIQFLRECLREEKRLKREDAEQEARDKNPFFASAGQTAEGSNVAGVSTPFVKVTETPGGNNE